MASTTRYFLKKSDRLTSRKKIESVFSNAKGLSDFPFRMLWLLGKDDAVLQAGVGVKASRFKRAVDRNRIKRIIRESYRLQKNPLYEHLKKNNLSLSVFILYNGNEMPDYNIVFEKVGKLITRLIPLIDENTKRHT